MSRGPTRAVVMTDGRAGNENQALGLAEAVARGALDRAPAILVDQLRISRRAAATPAAAADIAARLLGEGALGVVSPFWDRLRRGEETVGASDVVIGAGRRSAPAVAALRRRGARAVQILTPRMPMTAFDLVIAPAHDGATASNLVTMIGSAHRVHPSALAGRPPDPRLAALRPGATRVAVLVGGPSGSARFEPDDVERLAGALDALGASGAHLMATASRRTVGAARARLEAAVRGAGGYFWDGAGENPYFSLLAEADAIIVTADSVNMASEAAATTAPLFVAPLSGLAPKLARFHRSLEAVGRAQPLSALAASLAAGALGPATALTDMDEAAGAVLRLFDR